MGSKEPSRPFEGRKLTRKEQKKSDKMAAKRADLRAKSMPAPYTSERIDPVTGKPVYMPQGLDPTRAGGAPLPDAVKDSLPAVVPQSPNAVQKHTPAMYSTPFGIPAQPVANKPAARQEPYRAPAPEQTEAKPKRERKQKQAPTLAEQALRKEKRQERKNKLNATVPGQYANGVFSLGILVTLISAGLAISIAATQDTIGWPWLAGSGAGTLIGLSAVFRSWPQTTGKTRGIVLPLAGLVLAALIVGVATNPVIIDGKVLSATSTQAQSVKLSQAIQKDLDRMAVLDELLAADITTARAQVRSYGPARDELQNMSAKWAQYQDLPDPAFSGVIDSVATAAQWEAEAMESKRLLLQEEDSEQQELLETQRASFTESWLAASTELNQVTAALNIPATTDTEGPHE